MSSESFLFLPVMKEPIISSKPFDFISVTESACPWFVTFVTVPTFGTTPSILLFSRLLTTNVLEV